ncbi:MAG: S8 family serine peptidase [bacterium]|nr:S8 family serine peptidase [bacterium]
MASDGKHRPAWRATVMLVATALAAASVGGFVEAGAQPSTADETAQLSAPTIALYPGDRSMTVTWEPPADLGAGADVTYDIAWIAGDQADDPDAEWTTITGVEATPQYRLLGPSGIENGVSYDVRVRAVTDHAGRWSDPATARPFERDRSSQTYGKRPQELAIPFGVPIGGHITYRMFDVFKVEMPERTGLLVRTGGSVGDTQCRLDYLSGDMVPASWTDYRGLRDDDQCVFYVVVNPGTYFIRISGHNAHASPTNHGSFFVYAELVAPTGGDTDTALPLEVGKETFGHLRNPDAADFWRIDVETQAFIDLHLEHLNAWVHPAIYDSAGEKQKAIVTPYHTYCNPWKCWNKDLRVRAALSRGTYYLKTTTHSQSGVTYVMTRRIDHEYRDVVTQCRASGRSEGVDDALAGCQWHLDNRGQRGGSRGEDANVVAAHLAGYLGEGVHVAVVDTGIDLSHPDLVGNTDPSRSHVYCGSDTAAFRPASDHGTAVAGLVAARDNTIGMRGVAPRAMLHNRRLVDSGCDVTGENIADALTRDMERVCVNTNSWGYRDGSWATPAPLLFDLAVNEGIADGCGGKGIVYVWSAGNGHIERDDSNLSELANYYGVMAVGAVNAKGARSNYSETGTNLWVSAPSNVRAWNAYLRTFPGIATLTTRDRYRKDFGGTSAAAPIVAGVAALVRAANSDLTWRDVKLILAESARRNDRGGWGWFRGAATYGDPSQRYWYNRQYGFGVVDAKAAVDLAETWTNLPPMITQTQTSDEEPFQIPDRPEVISKSVTFDDTIEFVEFVQLDTSFKTSHLRDLRIELISPSGTEVLVVAELDGGPWSHPALNEPFRFGVARLLGEPAQGTWTLRVTGKKPDRQASLDGWGITLYGHRVRPASVKVKSVDHAADGELTVAWGAPAHAGASPVSGYELRYITAAAADRADTRWTVVKVPGGADAVSHTLTGLEAVPHDVQVRALNSTSAGVWSAAMSGTPRSGPNVDPAFAADSASLQVAENTASGAAVGEPVAAEDADADATLTYTLGGADASVFAIDRASGQISTSAAFDFEAPADSDGDNVYELSVSVSDGLDARWQPDASVDDSVAVSIEVVDVDEPLVLAGGLCDAEVADWASGEWECVFEATDPEGLAVAWSLSGADAALFRIDAGVLSLAEASDAGSVYEVTVETAAGGHTVSVEVSLAVIAVNRAPVFGGEAAQRLDNALPAFIVSLPVSKADFSDPDGDELTFTLSASRDDVHVSGGVGYSERVGRIWFVAKNACGLAGLDPPAGDAYYTVLTLTATDSGGAAAQATATFRTDPETFDCPSLEAATVHGATITLDFDADLAKGWVLDAGVISPSEPTADEFKVAVDGAAAALADADADALAVAGDTITITLASPVTADQTVTVSYTPDGSPVAAAFAEQPAANNTPASPEPAEPDCTTAPEVATKPTCAAVSGNELTLTFNRGLAAIDAGSAGALIFSFLVEGAYHHGQPVTQSPSRVVVDGSTMTLTLGTPIQPGDDVTVTFFGGTLKDTDGTSVAAFTATLATTARD